MFLFPVKLVANKRDPLGKLHTHNFTTSYCVSYTVISILHVLNIGICQVLRKKIAIVHINTET